MAAGLGFKTFTTGEVLTAADTNGYLMQGVLVFADATARDAAITSPQEGQFAYLKDTNVTMYYTGSAWTNLDTTGMVNPMTTTGDTIYASSGSTPARLAVGSTGQVLTVAGGVPTWATASSGGYTLLSTTTLSTATTTVSGISQSYQDIMIIIYGLNVSSAGTITFKFRDSTPSDLATLMNGVYSDASTTIGTAQFAYFGNLTSRGNVQASQSDNCFSFVLRNYTQTGARKQIIYSSQFQSSTYSNRTQGNESVGTYGENAFADFSVTTSAGTFSAGTIKMWGLK